MNYKCSTVFVAVSFNQRKKELNYKTDVRSSGWQLNCKTAVTSIYLLVGESIIKNVFY